MESTLCRDVKNLESTGKKYSSSLIISVNSIARNTSQEYSKIRKDSLYNKTGFSTKASRK